VVEHGGFARKFGRVVQVALVVPSIMVENILLQDNPMNLRCVKTLGVAIRPVRIEAIQYRATTQHDPFDTACIESLDYIAREAFHPKALEETVTNSSTARVDVDAARAGAQIIAMDDGIMAFGVESEVPDDELLKGSVRNSSQ